MPSSTPPTIWQRCLVFIAQQLFKQATGQEGVPYERYQKALNDLSQDRNRRALSVSNTEAVIDQLNKSHQQTIDQYTQSLEQQRQALGQLEYRFNQLQVKFEFNQSQLAHYTSVSTSENQRLLDTINWLSGTIAHDLRAPVRAIDAYTFFLADDLGVDHHPETLKTLSEIRRNGQRMGVLVDGLIDYMRISVTPIAPSSVDLNDLFKQVTGNFITPASIHIASNLPTVFADQQLLQRALNQLVDNAIKFSRSVDKPRISVEFDERAQLIQIKDNGVGFDTSHRNKLFKLFHRLHGNDEYEGEGIGLCLAQRIIERHQGSLHLERIGDQTVAIFSLALKPSTE